MIIAPPDLTRPAPPRAIPASAMPVQARPKIAIRNLGFRYRKALAIKGITLDPRSMAMIEELIGTLKQHVTLALVTHNLTQAARCVDQVAFLYLGELVECGPAAQIFPAPRQSQTQRYVTRRFG